MRQQTRGRRRDGNGDKASQKGTSEDDDDDDNEEIVNFDDNEVVVPVDHGDHDDDDDDDGRDVAFSMSLNPHRRSTSTMVQQFSKLDEAERQGREKRSKTNGKKEEQEQENTHGALCVCEECAVQSQEQMDEEEREQENKHKSWCICNECTDLELCEY